MGKANNSAGGERCYDPIKTAEEVAENLTGVARAKGFSTEKGRLCLPFYTDCVNIVICAAILGAGMQANMWLSYSDLAWTESIITSPDDYAEETDFYVKIIKENVEIEAKTLLHLGCGAGGNDYTFRKHFKVTGVDISEVMLGIARKINPDVTYLHGDLRSIDLKERFDAVAIPDSIDYMATLPELEIAIGTACKHLNPGGVLLIVAKTREEFRENNFCYIGVKDDIEITIFENNYIPKTARSTYEATLIYLIRRKGKLSIHTDCHILGLFSQTEWLSLLTGAGLEVKQIRLDGAYDRFFLGEGEYHMQVFVGVKPT
jgi:SAM-dependent methyltransferase